MTQQNNTSRRNFFKKASIAGVSAISIPSIVSGVFAAETFKKKISINAGDTILFQGDSITDAGRKKDDANANSSSALGGGYAMLAASELLFKYPGKDLKIYNRGISGNKVLQLSERWQKDTLDLKPQVLSLLIGVNDFWHTVTGKYAGTLKIYRDDLKALLDKTKQALPDVKMIIGEPYAIIGIKAVDATWFPAFNDYRAAAKELAGEFDAVFIPYQAIYEKAIKSAPGVYWTADGVHPSLAGARLMAHAWLEAVK